MTIAIDGTEHALIRHVPFAFPGESEDIDIVDALDGALDEYPKDAAKSCSDLTAAVRAAVPGWRQPTCHTAAKKRPGAINALVLASNDCGSRDPTWANRASGEIKDAQKKLDSIRFL